MCGIAGLVEAPGRRVDEATLRVMGAALVHRGPDAGATWVGSGPLAHVGLAHRRLSILDHAGGHQPMHDAAAGIAVVFNGQIYNHLALRRELRGRGHVFVSDHSDTEVLVHGTRAYGPALVPRLSAMFAYAAVDERSQTLFLARDPVGKKPLYVALPAFFDDGVPRVAFASELGALERLPHARNVVNPTAFARYLAFDFVPDPDCISAGVLKIPPGHGLTIDLQRPGTWNDLASAFVSLRPLSFGAARVPAGADRVRDLLRERIDAAVQTRLVADVPVGVFLSGGLDSSLVAAFAARHAQQVHTFSIAFTAKSFDESAHARRVAEHLHTQHHEQLLDERALLDVLPLLGAHLSEPFADHSIVPTYLLAKFASERVKVALGGDGGDELFLGYPTFLAEKARPALFDVAAKAVRPALDAAARAARHLPVSHKDFALDFKVQRTLDGLSELHPLRRHQLFLTGATDARMRALLSVGTRAQLSSSDLLNPLDALENAAKRAGAKDVLDVVTYGYLKTYLAAGVLQKVDRATMAVGLEARAPLLDLAVVDLALSLPSAMKLRGRTHKAVLKDAARGLLPDAIIDRKKKGFGMPVASWLCGPLRPLVGDLLGGRALADDGLLDAPAVSALVDEHLQRKRNHRKILWSLLMYRLWRERVAP